MYNLIGRFLIEEDGQGMVEYGLIIAGVALAVLAVLWIFGDDITSIFENIDSEITSNVTTSS